MKYIKKFEEERYMSDEDIESDYENMKIIGFKVERLIDDGGASGYIEIEFDDAESDEDYNSTQYDSWIKYDSGPKIAFDNYYPEKENIILKDYIEKGIIKYKIEQDADKYNL